MYSNTKLLFLLIVLASLAGCVSPRYQTLYRYEPPSDAAGRACLEPCGQKLSACKDQCQEKHQVCLKNIEPMVEARYKEAMLQYQRDYRHYQYALEAYQRQLTLGWYYFDPYYGSWPYYYGYEPRFPPTPPFKPNREQIAKQIAQQQCDRDCGCQSIYDACFLGCGGMKIPEVKCIAHCPPEK